MYQPTDQDWLNLWPLIEELTRVAGNQLDDDVKTAAVEGVAEAARDYDPARNAPFVAFARLRIRDRVKDCLKKFSRHPSLHSIDELLEIADHRGDESNQDDVAACGTSSPEENLLAKEAVRERAKRRTAGRKPWAA